MGVKQVEPCFDLMTSLFKVNCRRISGAYDAGCLFTIHHLIVPRLTLDTIKHKLSGKRSGQEQREEMTKNTFKCRN